MARKKSRSSQFESLINYTINARGQKVYTKKPSQFTKSELNQLAQNVNNALRRLERAGKQGLSAEYRQIMRYAIDKGNKNKTFNVNTKTGTVRVTKNLSQVVDKADYVRTLQNILTSETITVSGTKRVEERAYKTFIERPDIKAAYGDNLPTKDEFLQAVLAWKNNVSQDMKESRGSEIILDFLQAKKDMGIFNLTDREVVEGMKRFSESETAADPYDFFVDTLSEIAFDL